MKIHHHILFVLTAVILFAGCVGRSYRQASSGMEGTIARDQRFFVINTTDFKKDDIVVFDIYSNDYTKGFNEEGHYEKNWQKRVYRLIGLSGDTVSIINGNVYVNHELMKFPEKGKTDYRVVSTVPVEELESVMPASQNISGNYEYTAQLSNAEAADYRKRKPSVISVEKITATYDPGDTFMIRPCDTCKWTLDDFGPLYIPRPGETVNITDQNFNLYQHVPGITKGPFTIKEPLYFLMGDNRHGAEDSRFTGFISHSKMYGVVKL